MRRPRVVRRSDAAPCQWSHLLEPIRVGFFDPCPHRGGTVSYLLDLIASLDRTRFRPVLFTEEERPWQAELRSSDVQIVCGSGSGGGVTERSDVAGAAPTPSRQVRVEKRGWKRRLVQAAPPAVTWSAGMTKEVLRLRRLFRAHPVDVLHINVTGVAEPAPVAARLAGVRNIVCAYHISPTSKEGRGRDEMCYKLLERFAMRSANRVIHICKAALEGWERRCPGRPGSTVLIYNGVSADRLGFRSPVRVAAARRALGLPSHAPVVTFVGAFFELKGHRHLLRALPQVLERYPNLIVAFAGGGPLEDEMRALAKELGVERALRFLGFVTDVRSLLEASDVYVQPSLLEVCPISVLEASGTGLPVVASAVGGIPELIEDGVTGFLVPPGDPSELARRLTQVLDMPDTGASMGAAGRQRILDGFTSEHMAAATMRVYEDLACTRPPRGLAPDAQSGLGLHHMG